MLYKTEEDKLLSEREIQVLLCLKEGLSNPEIADKLCITISTVKAHISSLLQKLNVKNRMEALLILFGAKDTTNKLIKEQIKTFTQNNKF